MENDENRGLIDKKAYEDQFTTFCQFNLFLNSFINLSLFSLSITLGHLRFFLGHFSIRSRKPKKAKRKQRSRTK